MEGGGGREEGTPPTPFGQRYALIGSMSFTWALIFVGYMSSLHADDSAEA